MHIPALHIKPIKLTLVHFFLLLQFIYQTTPDMPFSPQIIKVIRRLEMHTRKLRKKQLEEKRPVAPREKMLNKKER